MKKVLLFGFFIFSAVIISQETKVENEKDEKIIENAYFTDEQFEALQRLVTTRAVNNLKEACLGGLSGGISGGLRGMQAPIGTLLNRLVVATLKPVETATSIRRSIFLTINSTALNFAKLAQWNYRLNQSVSINMIDPANSSNKVLRRALLNDAESDKKDESQDEYLFGIKLVIEQLENIKESLEKAISVYQSVPISMKILKPYNSSDLAEIIFLSQKLVKQLNQFIKVSDSIENIGQLTDKKDLIQRFIKSITSHIKDLAIIVDPDSMFDAQRKGLKLQIETTAGRINANASLGSGL